MKTYFKLMGYLSLGIFFILLSFYELFNSKVSLHNYSNFSSYSEAKASQIDKQIIQLTALSTSYRYKAWYLIQLGNVPVGTLAVSVDNTSTGFPSDYNAQFASRIGYSPFLSILRGNLNNLSNNKLEITQNLTSKSESGIFQEADNKWLQEDNKLIMVSNKGATLQGLFPVNIPSADSMNDFSVNTDIFYFKRGINQKPKTILIPFTGTFAAAPSLNLIYDHDNFLLSADLPIEENIALSFKRISDSQYHDYLKTIPETLIDFGWLSSIESNQKELDRLKKILNMCIAKTSSLNKLVINKIPQSSYLSYRKLINVSHFCMETLNQLNKKADSNFNKINVISDQVIKLIKEDKLELPYSITNSPNLTVFYNDTISFLWPKITDQLIDNMLEEIDDNFDLEKNRKSLLGIQINIASLQPRAVVRADIKLIDPMISFSIQEANTPSMNSNSVYSFSTNSKEKSSSYLINGQFFSKNQNIDLNLLCEKNNGKLGIDLGDAPQIIVNSDGIRGIWDTNTRVYVARAFAIKTASTKNCRQIIFRAPQKILNLLNSEMENFKNTIIGPDNEILLSNNVQKKLLVMPGKYRMTTSSLVTGSIISTHEFNVDASTNTDVTAKAN